MLFPLPRSTTHRSHSRTSAAYGMESSLTNSYIISHLIWSYQRVNLWHITRISSCYIVVLDWRIPNGSMDWWSTLVEILKLWWIAIVRLRRCRRFRLRWIGYWDWFLCCRYCCVLLSPSWIMRSWRRRRRIMTIWSILLIVSHLILCWCSVPI